MEEIDDCRRPRVSRIGNCQQHTFPKFKPLDAAVIGGALALCSHAALDLIPHFDPSGLGVNYLITGSIGFWLAVADNAAMMALYLYWRSKLRLSFLYSGWIVLCAWLPDFLTWLTLKHLWNGSVSRYFSDFHRDVLHFWKPGYEAHPELFTLGLLTTLVVGITCTMKLRTDSDLCPDPVIERQRRSAPAPS